MEAKKSYLSKTLWINFLLAGIVLLKPDLGGFINEQNLLLFMPLLNMGLRLVSKDKIELW
jgi:hypothetical protein